MRLIDADALMEKANEHYRLALKRTEEAPFNDRYREQTIEREKFLGFIANAPTVDMDIVPLMQDIVANIPEIVDKAVKLYIEERRQTMTKEEILKELWNCRDELCLKCERYKEAYRGACEDCRYNFSNMEKWKGEQE